MVVALTLCLIANWIYQVVRKPSELLFPVSQTWLKSPAETWQTYAPIFEQYSTRVMTPDLLAAMAQVEGSGNPIARTYWRWSWSVHPSRIYRPASSAVGMYQITDGTYAEASRYCIRDHVAMKADGAESRCGFVGMSSRLFPSTAVELTSAYVDRSVAAILARNGLRSPPLRQQQALAAVVHLCGAGAGNEYARHGFRLGEGQRCGDQEIRGYLRRVDTARASFARMLARSPTVP